MTEEQNGSQSAEQNTGRPDGQSNAGKGQESRQEPENGDTFPRSYVERLRNESQGYRERAKKGEQAMTRLVDAVMVSSTNGILVDPTDLTFDPETMSGDDGLPDADKIRTAAQELVEKKPHRAPRRPSGDIGQGQRGSDEEFSLGALLRANAG